ncbi:MAG: hypothetical protein ACT4OK_07405 [Gemmobacter sp.]
MDLIADVLLAAGALGAGLYCYVLARRLKQFQTLESGMGGAIAVLSAQVDDMTRALDRARGAAGGQVTALEAETGRAEAAARRIELLLAALHDLPDPQAMPPAPSAPPLQRDSVVPQDRRRHMVRRRPHGTGLEAAE